MKNCCYCNKDIPFMRSKFELSDGFICSKCIKQSGVLSISENDSLEEYNCGYIINFLDEYIPLAKQFSKPKRISSALMVDEKHRLVKINGNLYRYENVLNFEVYQNPPFSETRNGGYTGSTIGGIVGSATAAINSIRKGRGFFRTIAGNAAGQAIGTALGNVISTKLGSTICQEFYITVYLQGAIKKSNVYI